MARIMDLISKNIPRPLTVFAIGALCLLLCGCSTFNRAWRAAGQQPISESPIEGRWEGRWVSEVNGHEGKLLCLVSRRTDSEYAARFRATYLKVLRFSYTVPLSVEHREGVWYFHGEENLGKMAGGLYHYSGRATQTNFHSSYRSKYDHGVFEMRPVPAGAEGEPR